MNAPQLLLIFAFVFFVLAALNVPSPPRLSWGWLGAAFWSFATLWGSGLIHS